MSIVAGLLLPRSTDYPSLGFDILDGLRFNLHRVGLENVRLLTENIGFGEDASVNYARAEKLLVQDDVDVLIAYCTVANAEPLYSLATATGKPFIFLDAGMQVPDKDPSPQCYHISLQGIHACRLAGYMAGASDRKVLMATSFYDGGYRGPWEYTRGLAAAGGSVCGNYVSGYKEAEFSIDAYMNLLQHSGAQSVAACFSSYLAGLFMKALKEKEMMATALPFYCSPFMAEEQLLHQCDFPGGVFHAIVPWGSSLQNAEQSDFLEAVQRKKNKYANIFHLLGWEAGTLLKQLLHDRITQPDGLSFESPRGIVNIHPVTRHTYAPLYKALIVEGPDGKCVLHIEEKIAVSPHEHVVVHADKPDAGSGWKNNYLCI